MTSSNFFILYFYLPWKFYLSSLSGQKFWRTRWRMTPQLWHLKFVIFYLPILIFFSFFFYIHLLWKFHVSTVNGWKAWIWRSQLRVPHFGTNKFRQITLCYIYLIWKSSVQALVLKKFKFFKPRFGRIIVVHLNSAIFHLSFTITYILKLSCV